jgi:hypothetical protein
VEALLNSLWLIAAGFGVVAWAVCGRNATRGTRQSHLSTLIAMGCVLVLLFPVISVTDDLYSAQTAIERVVVNKLKATSDGDVSALHVLHADIVTPPAWPSLLHTAFLFAAVASLSFQSFTLPVRTDRAPPSPLF